MSKLWPNNSPGRLISRDTSCETSFNDVEQALPNTSDKSLYPEQFSTQL
jgi:hypothetical protein